MFEEQHNHTPHTQDQIQRTTNQAKTLYKSKRKKTHMKYTKVAFHKRVTCDALLTRSMDQKLILLLFKLLFKLISTVLSLLFKSTKQVIKNKN